MHSGKHAGKYEAHNAHNAHQAHCLVAEDDTEEGYADQSLADDLKRGFDLVGEQPESGGVLPPKLVLATLPVATLDSNAALRRKAMQFARGSAGDSQSMLSVVACSRIVTVAFTLLML